MEAIARFSTYIHGDVHNYKATQSQLHEIEGLFYENPVLVLSNIGR